MSCILDELKLSLDHAFDGLVKVSKSHPHNVSFAEKRIIDDTLKITENIDFIFFRRFAKGDVRTSQAVAYIIDNTSGKLSKKELAQLHHTLWLNGTVPLLYIDNASSVDILSCAAEAVSKKANDWDYKPLDFIVSSSKNINEQINQEKINQYSAFRLANGTFWEDERNKIFFNMEKSAHNVLLEKIKSADRAIDGQNKHVVRRLLLITLLIKYLEDRGVFDTEKNFFSKCTQNAESFYDVLDKGTVENIETLLKCLENKFNGDIFTINKKITKRMIQNIVSVVNASTDANGQLYFWQIP